MLKSKEVALSKSWVVTQRHGASYTGGAICVCNDGLTAASSCADRVAIVDLGTGAVQRLIPEDIAVSCRELRF